MVAVCTDWTLFSCTTTGGTLDYRIHELFARRRLPLLGSSIKIHAKRHESYGMTYRRPIVRANQYQDSKIR